MSAEVKMMSALDIFKQSQETFEDAKKKSNEESGNKTKYFRLSQDGTFNVRILPLAPVIDKVTNTQSRSRFSKSSHQTERKPTM